MAMTVKRSSEFICFGSPLPVDAGPNHRREWAADQYWQSSLRRRKEKPSLFPDDRTACRAASPPQSDGAGCAASHLLAPVHGRVQDTTQIQYDLVRHFPRFSDTIVTAVGDNKQQIMRWAMAMEDPFAAFEADFKSKRTPLLQQLSFFAGPCSYPTRSGPSARRKVGEPVSKTVERLRAIACDVGFLIARGGSGEIAAFIVAEMRAHGLGPRDFVLLVRQKAADYAAVLQPEFAEAGIPLRNEAGQAGAIMLQELLAEEASELIICVLRLAMTARAGRHWTECQEALGSLRGIGPDDEVEQGRFAKELDAYATRLRRDYPAPRTAQPASRKLVDDVLGFIGRGRLVAAHPAYAQGDWLEKVLGVSGGAPCAIGVGYKRLDRDA